MCVCVCVLYTTRVCVWYRASRGHGLHCVTGWRAVSVCEPCESGAGLDMPPTPPPTRRFGCIVPPASTNAGYGELSPTSQSIPVTRFPQTVLVVPMPSPYPLPTPGGS